EPNFDRSTIRKSPIRRRNSLLFRAPCRNATSHLFTECSKVAEPSRRRSMTNAELLARRNAAVPRGVGHATAVFAERASNAELWDAEGRRYVDFAGGIAVLNVGHSHPKLVAAVKAQAEKFTHTAFQVCPYESYVQVAERLNGL